MARKGMSVYLPLDLELRVQKLAREQHRSESSVITQAVKALFQPKDNAALEEPARRQIARVDLRLEKVIRELLLCKSTLLLFVRVWLEHNPPLDEETEESAAASAAARFERFLDLVAQDFSNGRYAAVSGPPDNSTSEAAALNTEAAS